MKIEYIFIKPHNDFCNSKESFVNLLASNSRIVIDENEIIVSQKKVAYTLEHECIENSKEDVFYMVIQSEEEDKVAALETVDSVMRRINDMYEMFQINTIVDEVSIDYAIKLYPKIASLENQLRKIIYLFMSKNVGSKWIQKNIPDDMKKSVEKTMEKNQLEDISEDYLYNADFIVLGWFFFSKYSLNGEYQRLIAELKKEENHTKEKIEELLEIYEKKSNWERYFSDKIQVDNLSGKWEELYAYRNKVAHSKRICKNEYKKASELIDELKQAFDDCIEHINDVVMTEAQTEAIEQVAQETIAASVVDNIQVVNPVIRESLRLSSLPMSYIYKGQNMAQEFLQGNGAMLVSNITKENSLLGNTSIFANGLKVENSVSKYLMAGSNDLVSTEVKNALLSGVNKELFPVSSEKNSFTIADSTIKPAVAVNANTQKGI